MYLGFEVIGIESQANLIHSSFVANTLSETILIVHYCPETEHCQVNFITVQQKPRVFNHTPTRKGVASSHCVKLLDYFIHILIRILRIIIVFLLVNCRDDQAPTGKLQKLDQRVEALILADKLFHPANVICSQGDLQLTQQL